MNLVALVESETHVCCRYRLAALRAPLAAAGVTLTFQRLTVFIIYWMGL